MGEKRKISKTRSKLSINTYKRPMIFVILMMVMINIAILVIAALTALIIDDSFNGFLDAFGNGSLKWMLTPNAILGVENPQTLALAVTVLIIGMVLFSGTIIALTTNMIKEYFNKKKRGSGRIYLKDHIVILNWNDKVPELVADLLHVDIEEYNVMILADVDKHFAEKQIINAINSTGKTKIKSLNVLFKSGDPLITSYLYDVSVQEAKAIIIMNKDMHEEVAKDMSKSDLNVIKTILHLSNIEFTHKPPIVAEVKRIESKAKIETMTKYVKNLKPHVVLPVCFDRRLGQVIAQTIIHSFMEDVYLSMFSFGGSEVYYLDKPFSYALEYATDAVPLASKGKGSFVLSKNYETIYNETEVKTETRKLKVNDFDLSTNLDVYIIGTNNKLNFLIDAFKEYEKLYNIGFTVHCLTGDEIDTLPKLVEDTEKHVKIVLLSDETQESDSLDANVINNLIQLEGLIDRKDCTIIVELLDPKNAQIIKDFSINNTIISNKMISLLLSKLALFPKTASFYENLLTLEIDETEDDHEVIIRKASKVFDEAFPLRFNNKKEFINSSYDSLEDMICFGVFKGEVLELFSDDLLLDEFVLEDNDLLVIMKI